MSETQSITTKTGDDGTTALFSGERVAKDHPRTEAYGDVDELNSILGVARASSTRDDVQAALRTIQRELFTVAAELATTSAHLEGLSRRVDAAMVDALEEQRQAVEAAIRMPSGFIIPGGTVGGAHIDHARTVARRCERAVIGLQRSGEISNSNLTVWLNRLSDMLWLLARLEEGADMDQK